MAEDIIRVLRILEYVGPRSDIERQINNSIHGEKRFGPQEQIVIRAATIGSFPEILNQEADIKDTVPEEPVRKDYLPGHL